MGSRSLQHFVVRTGLWILLIAMVRHLHSMSSMMVSCQLFLSFSFCMKAGLVCACWRWYLYLLVIDRFRIESVAGHDGRIVAVGW